MSKGSDQVCLSKVLNLTANSVRKAWERCLTPGVTQTIEFMHYPHSPLSINISGLPVQVRRLQINQRILSLELVLDLHIYTQIYTNSAP